jgi:hypothetical protein
MVFPDLESIGGSVERNISRRRESAAKSYITATSTAKNRRGLKNSQAKSSMLSPSLPRPAHSSMAVVLLTGQQVSGIGRQGL